MGGAQAVHQPGGLGRRLAEKAKASAGAVRAAGPKSSGKSPAARVRTWPSVPAEKVEAMHRAARDVQKQGVRPWPGLAVDASAHLARCATGRSDADAGAGAADPPVQPARPVHDPLDMQDVGKGAVLAVKLPGGDRGEEAAHGRKMPEIAARFMHSHGRLPR